MADSKFVIRKGHFHTGDRNRFVLTGWYDGTDGVRKEGENGGFTVCLDKQPLEIQTLVFADDSVRQKYAKLDQNVKKEYVIIISLPENLPDFRRLRLYLADGTVVYDRPVSGLVKLQKQLECRITDVQITGTDCVLGGWAASQNPVRIRVTDSRNNPVKCEITRFPKPDVELEYREAEHLPDCGFSIRVPMQGRKRMILHLTDGVTFMRHSFSAIDKNRVLLYVKKAHYFMKRNGMAKTCKRAVNEIYELIGDTGNYMKWREKNRTSDRELARQRAQDSTGRPLVFVVTGYRECPELEETAASLASQTYGNWKWIIAVNSSETENLKQKLKAVQTGADGGRHVPTGKIVPLTVEYREADHHAHNTEAGYNWKIMSAFDKIAGYLKKQGQNRQEPEDVWITRLECGDTLEPDALYACMELAAQKPDADMCYTDEDQISADSGTYMEPVFKSDFNIDMLRAMNYLGHLVLVRGDLALRCGCWNPDLGTESSYDYYLRSAEMAQRIIHLTRAVCHIRESVPEKPSAAETGRTQPAAAKMILDAHYKRMGIPATVEESDLAGIYRTCYHWKETPLVSINIPNKDHVDDLDTCVQSVLKYCTYPDYEIVIIENNSVLPQTFEYYDKICRQDSRVRVIYWKDSYNFAKITNYGVAHSRGEYILLLNNDTEVISPGFMEEMLGYCMREDVGVCGARLFYFDDTVQHAGVIVGLAGICGEGFQRFPKENPGYQNRICCPQDYSAVTAACMMTPKRVFEEVGGMDGELQIAYNDIDYCLKVRQTGRLVVYNPFAMLYHYEYKSRGTENTAAKLARYNREVELFTTRWADLISAGDPYYNPNLTRRYQDFSLRRIELLQ